MMQILNHMTAAQVKRLEEKRDASLIIITNAVAIVYDQAEDGGYAHWEWPRAAESHDLSIILRLVDDI